MKKLITTMMLCAVLSLCGVCSSVYASDFTQDAEFLFGVGVLNKDSSEYKKSDSVKLGAFVNMALNLVADRNYMGDDLTDSAVADAKSYELLPPTHKMSAESQLTFDEAVDILERAIGYEAYKAGVGHLSRTIESGLVKNISYTEGEILSAEKAVMLLKNACESNPVIMTGYPYNTEVSIHTETTVLEHSKNTYKKTGVVTGNNRTRLYVCEGVADGFIEIDDKLYVCNNTKKFGEYLGYRVTYYVRLGDNKEDDSVRYVAAKDNNEVITVNADEIVSISDDLKTLTYQSETGKKETLEISSAPKVIYNQKAYSSYVKADFMIKSGNITVIKSPVRGETDVVKITSYETMVVDRVSQTNEKIYNKYKHTGATSEIALENNDYIITKDGKEIAFTDLKEWNVLNVAISKSSGDKFIEILVSEAQEIVKTEKLTNDYVEAIGYIYYMSDSYMDSIKYNKIIGEKLKVGSYQIYLLDAFEKIAAVRKDYSHADDEYVYITKVYYDDIECRFCIRFFDVKEESWFSGQFAKAVTVNTEKYKGEDALFNSVLFDADRKSVNQLAKVKFNLDGEVSKVETAVASEEADESKFTKKQTSSTTFWTENLSFMYEVFVADNATILCVPEDSGDISGYYTISRSGIYDDYALAGATSVVAYDFDEFSRSSMIVITYEDREISELSRIVDDLFVVQKKIIALGGDDETHTQLIGHIGNYSDIAVTAKDESVVEDIDTGDVVVIKLDGSGRLVQADKIFSANALKTSQNVYEDAKYAAYTGSNRNARGQLLNGWVKNINLNFGKNENMVILDSVEKLPVKLNGSVTNAIIYDCELEKARIGTIDECEIDDLMIVRLKYSTVTAIVIVKNLDI